MEKVEIVDVQGNFTGQILDIEEAHAQSLLHPAVIVVIVNNQKQVLLGKRSNNEEIDGGKWGLIGGHVSAGETQKHALSREIKEEIGLDIAEDELMLLPYQEVNFEPNNAHVIYFYYLKTNLKAEDCVVEKNEISNVKWFDIDAVINAINNHDARIVAKIERVRMFEMIKNLL